MYSIFLLEPAIPITLQPKSFAIWPTTEPTAPLAAETTTVSPFWIFPILNNPK